MKDLEIINKNMPLAILQNDAILTAVVKAEARVTAFVKIKQLSLKATTCHDWVSLGGRPYLQDTGTEKIAGLFSPIVSTPIISREDFPDGHYMYTCDGEAEWGGKRIPVMGSRSSRDKFFIQYGKDDKGNRVDLPTEELLIRIDPGDVRKSALTNYRNNAIKDVLGLEGITWTDLEVAEIKKSEVVGVEYGGQEQSKDAKDNASKIKTMMKEMYGNNYGSQLKELTKWTNKDGKEIQGKTSLSGVKDSQMNVIYRKIKDAYGAWKNQPAPELLNSKSKRFKDAVKAVGITETPKRVDELLALADGIFDAQAIKDLTTICNDQKEVLSSKDKQADTGAEF